MMKMMAKEIIILGGVFEEEGNEIKCTIPKMVLDRKFTHCKREKVESSRKIMWGYWNFC